MPELDSVLRWAVPAPSASSQRGTRGECAASRDNSQQSLSALLLPTARSALRPSKRTQVHPQAPNQFGSLSFPALSLRDCLCCVCCVQGEPCPASPPGMIPAASGSTAQGLICISVEMMISKATTSSCLCWEAGSAGSPALGAHLPLGTHLWGCLHLSTARWEHLAESWSVPD